MPNTKINLFHFLHERKHQTIDLTLHLMPPFLHLQDMMFYSKHSLKQHKQKSYGTKTDNVVMPSHAAS